LFDLVDLVIEIGFLPLPFAHTHTQAESEDSLNDCTDLIATTMMFKIVLHFFETRLRHHHPLQLRLLLASSILVTVLWTIRTDHTQQATATSSAPSARASRLQLYSRFLPSSPASPPPVVIVDGVRSFSASQIL